MTIATSVPEATARSELLLEAGATSSERDQEGWEEHASAYLASYPEISALVPTWADEVDFSTIEDDCDGTIFSFSTSIGDAELYGVGKVLDDGTVHLEDDGAPNLYLPGEVECRKVGDITQFMLDLARDLISAAGLLRSEPKLLRRAAGTEEALREREQ